MNILYDLEIKDYDFFHSDMTETEKVGTEKVKSFIRQRIGVLKDRINNEEKEDPSCSTIIYILPGDKAGRVEFNYSDDLIDKMKDCFSNDDWNYLARILQDGL